MAGLSVGAAVAVGAVLIGVYAAQGAQGAQVAVGTSPGAVALKPASGAISSTPTWSTTTACPAGFQGSAVFRAVRPNGTTFSISPAVAKVTTPFNGTLQASLTEIQSVAGVSNGGSEEFVVICFSGDSLTGTSRPDMDTFITYSANGTSYTSAATAPPGLSSSASPSPGGTGSGSHPSSSSTASSTHGTGGSNGTSGSTPGSTATVSPAGTPSPVDSNFAVTG
jgi:hypothetical protein